MTEDAAYEAHQAWWAASHFSPADGLELNVYVTSDFNPEYWAFEWGLRFERERGILTDPAGGSRTIEANRGRNLQALERLPEDLPEQFPRWKREFDELIQETLRQPIVIKEQAWLEILRNALDEMAPEVTDYTPAQAPEAGLDEPEGSPPFETSSAEDPHRWRFFLLDVWVPASSLCSAQQLAAWFVDTLHDYFADEERREYWGVSEDSTIAGDVNLFIQQGGPLTELRDAIRRREKLTLKELVAELETGVDLSAGDGWVAYLPPPVAIPHARLAEADTAADKFTQARWTVESVIRLAALTCLGSLAPPGTPLVRFVAESLTKTPTLGRFAEEIRNRHAEMANLFPSTASVLWRAPGKLSATGKFLLSHLTERRNRAGPHGNPTESAYRELFDELAPYLNELVSAAAQDWQGHALVLKRTVSLVPPDKYEYQLRELRGSHLVFPSARVVTGERLYDGRVYVSGPSGFLCVDPLLVCEVCPDCKLDEVFWIDRLDPEHPAWRSSFDHVLRKRSSPA